MVSRIVRALLKEIVTMEIFSSELRAFKSSGCKFSVDIGISDRISVEAFERKVFMVSMLFSGDEFGHQIDGPPCKMETPYKEKERRSVEKIVSAGGFF